MAPTETTTFKTRGGIRSALTLVGAVALAATLVGARTSSIQQGFGAFGPEGPRMREQLWLVPGADQRYPLRAIVFRPADDVWPGKRPLVVINHGTSEDTRLAVSMPVFYWMSRWFVERGFVVVLPQRRGHGGTGGPLAEAIGDCADPDHEASGKAAADDIEAALRFMQDEPFIDRDRVVVAGISTGGWASLALAARNPPGVAAIINFAGGRGGHAFGVAGGICGEDALTRAAASFGREARIPTYWFYAENDSYFGPDLARRLAFAWQAAGGKADLTILPPYRDEGHALAEDRAGWNLWGGKVETLLSTASATAGPK